MANYFSVYLDVSETWQTVVKAESMTKAIEKAKAEVWDKNNETPFVMAGVEPYECDECDEDGNLL